jgi:hypothetical protein
MERSEPSDVLVAEAHVSQQLLESRFTHGLCRTCTICARPEIQSKFDRPRLVHAGPARRRKFIATLASSAIDAAFDFGRAARVGGVASSLPFLRA